MSKNRKETPKVDVTAAKPLAHNPFAALSGKTYASVAVSAPAPVRIAPVKPPPLTKPRVRLRQETTGRSGKVITRISGLPPANLDAIASRLKRALGCGATVENMDVILLGTLMERATAWIEKAGDLSLITEEKPVATASHKTQAEPPAVPVRSSVQGLSGMKRGDVKRGQRVAIVLKADQPTGKLTEGVVRDLLTSADHHPRGIKVRLESGEVGRVQVILE